MRTVFSALTAVSLFACGSHATTPAAPAQSGTAPLEAEIELAVLMYRLQVHADKLWHSGAAENWPLAGFYVHEIEETLHEIQSASIEEDGHNISALVGRTRITTPMKDMKTAIKASDKEAFQNGYQALMTGCNSCHKEVEHGFIQVQVPTSPGLTNQRFAPQTSE